VVGRRVVHQLSRFGAARAPPPPPMDISRSPNAGLIAGDIISAAARRRTSRAAADPSVDRRTRNAPRRRLLSRAVTMRAPPFPQTMVGGVA